MLSFSIYAAHRSRLQCSSLSITYLCERSDCVTATGASWRLFFGAGVKLITEARTEYEPSYFRVGEGNNTACLATGFSRHKAASRHWNYSVEFRETKAVAISPNLDLYNQVIFPGGNAKKCESPGDPSPCVDVLEPDPKVNLMSLTILALRVIFIKTIIFNIIMTLRLWISQ
uniref:Uncharacterized protein n=1 Tax=Maylandia zebra TaxID=106582 RepID=A0A3P9D8P8_9CICH